MLIFHCQCFSSYKFVFLLFCHIIINFIQNKMNLPRSLHVTAKIWPPALQPRHIWTNTGYSMKLSIWPPDSKINPFLLWQDFIPVTYIICCIRIVNGLYVNMKKGWPLVVVWVPYYGVYNDVMHTIPAQLIQGKIIMFDFTPLNSSTCE